MKKTCKQCGKVFETECKKQIFCSKSCGSKDAWRKEKERRAEKKKSSHNLEKINEEARKLGLSYGKYKAMIYKQQMEEAR